MSNRYFSYRDGRLHASGVALDALAAEVGTPFYCYDADALEHGYRHFAAALSGLPATICYALKAATAQGFLTATDLADWLVRVLGMPFRRAHHVTGSIVKLAEQRGCGLAELPLDAMQAVEPGITEDVFSVLSVENAVASRLSDGGTAPERVREAVAAAKERFL